MKNINMILYKRSKIIYNIRNFFLKHNILEIETPLLTKYTITDVNLFPLKLKYKDINSNSNLKMWLITSPEYHMKRLLSLSIGSIYQICHAFRNEKIGDFHNPEFTILEWYQPFYNMFDIMEFIEYFFKKISFSNFCDKISYKDIFIKKFLIDPFNTNIKQLNLILKKLNHKHLINFKNTIFDLLNLIFLIGIEPTLGKKQPIFIYHYPAHQAMLSRINKKNICISDRFECFFHGIEVGNGFCELIDSNEQKKRFDFDNFKRIQKKFSQRLIDFRFINALKSKYMPNCSGIALGLDRIIMIMLKIKKINQVIPFSFQEC